MGKTIKINPVLKLYLEMSGTNHLCFGLWQEKDEPTLKNLQKAQDYYLEQLVSLIPKKIKTILDVGSGVGGLAMYLMDDYTVHSLSPDPYQEQLFKKNTENKVPFSLSTFETLEVDKTFDLIIFSESAQYITPNKIFSKAKKLLNPRGHVLISDYFKLETVRELILPEGKTALPSYFFKDLLLNSEQFGFKLMKEKDITKGTVKTLIYGEEVYFHFIKPFLNFIWFHLKPLHFIINFIINYKHKNKPTIKKNILNSLQPIDPKLFLKHMTYRQMLFQLG